MNQPTSDINNHILIELDQFNRTSELLFDDNKIVQRGHYKILREQIHRHLTTLPPLEVDTRYGHPNGSGWTQFIDGSRGAGKSTFLKLVKRALEADAELKNRIAFINVIDPSLIEHSEIPLLIILRHVCKQVDAALKQRRRLEEDDFHETWQRAFRGVAGGLSLFSKDYHPLNDLDPELFLDWGLERASHSTTLRAKMHHLFDVACNILGVQGLILGFDDADTDSTHAIKLLECIRKYLDTPRLMILVTGDLELYSLLARQHFAKTITGKPEAALDFQRKSRQGDRSEQYIRMIDHLEEQYLLKLFPIHRRMQLQPLWNVMQRDTCRVTHSSWKDAPFHIEYAVNSIIRLGLRIKSNSDAALYTQFLLKQPLRSVLQVMAQCAPHVNNLIHPELNEGNDSSALVNTLSRSLQALALTSLYKFSVDTDAIAAKELPALEQAVFDLSLYDGDIDTAPYLRPMSADYDIKACFAALAGEVPNCCAQNPGTALRYLLRGPGSVSLYSLAQAHINTNNASTSLNSPNQFKTYMGVGRREDSLDWARRATAVIALPYVNRQHRVLALGVVGLRGKGRLGQHAVNTAIQIAIKDKKFATMPVFALSIVNVATENGTRAYGSIFVLIGLIEKLLSSGSREPDMALTAFNRAYPPLTVSAPSWSLKGLTEIPTDDNTDDSETSALFQSKQDALWINLQAWLLDLNDLSYRTLPSSIFLGKIWTRLFFSLQNAAQELKRAEFGTMMEIFSLCVINAFLVEEAEHHLMRPSAEAAEIVPRVGRTNPRKSAKFFVDKLNEVKPNRVNFPFTAIIATCPLLLGFLDPRKMYSTALRPLFPESFDEKKIEDLLSPEALFDIMQNISLTGSGQIEKKPTSKKSETAGESTDSEEES